MAKKSGLLGVLAGISFALLGCLSIPQTYQERIANVDKKLVKRNNKETVDLEVLVNKDFLDRHGEEWQDNLFGDFKFVNALFKKEFGIKFEIDSVKYFELPNDMPADIHFFSAYLRLHYRPGQFDAFVFIPGYNLFHNVDGVYPTQNLGNHILVETYEPVIMFTRNLQVALSCFFGAHQLLSNPPGLHGCYSWPEEDVTIIR